jgi:hypothetical protein
MMELSRGEVVRRLGEVGYVADPQLAVAITLMRTFGRPLLLKGEAGVGKTEVSNAPSGRRPITRSAPSRTWAGCRRSRTRSSMRSPISA